jgi:hypothetical protein
MNKILPVLTIALVLATLAVLGSTRTQDKTGLQPAFTSLARVEDKLNGVNESNKESLSILQGLEERTKTLSERLDASMKPPTPPGEQEIADRVKALMSGKWDEFIAKAYLASGRIGVIQPTDGRTLKTIGDKVKIEFDKLGLRGDSADKAAKVVAETAVLYGRARVALASNPGALAFERKRLISEAGRKLGQVMKEYQLKRVTEVLETLMDNH